jgi:formylglycine-generating enzyme required for sulfatase activity
VNTKSPRFKNGRPVKQELVTITRNGRTVVRMSLEPAATSSLRDEVVAPVAGKEGWVSLINGRDLSGWKTHPEQPGNWRVEHGVVVAEGPPISHLYTERSDFTDFHVYMEVKVSEGGDSGLHFRSPYGPSHEFSGRRYPGGYEVQIRSDDLGSLVAFYDTPHQTSSAPRPAPDSWIALEVIAIENHVVVKINGHVALDFNDRNHHFRKGHLALQCAGDVQETKVQVRKLLIKELSAPAQSSDVWTGWPADAPPPAIAPFDAEQAKAHQEAWAKHLGVPVEQEIILGQDKNGKEVTLAMVLIPPGEFLLGSTAEEQSIFLHMAKAAQDERAISGIPAEGPQRRVRITKPFWLSRHEVTIGQFRRFAEAAIYKTDAERDGLGGKAIVDGNWKQSPEFIWDSDLGFPQTDDHPVSNVTWNDAAAFSKWLSNHSGWTFTLPTEAQWEYACRAGTETYWHSGDSEAGVEQYGWVGTNSRGAPHPVGLLKPNAFGLYDMHGNLWEWCADWFALDTYAKSSQGDPTGPSAGAERVLRGGSWITLTRRCRTAHRGHYSLGYRISYLGFRVAAALPDAKLSESPSESKPKEAASEPFE